MNSTIGMTVETEAMSATHITPSSLAWMPPLEQRDDREADGGAGGDAGGERDRGRWSAATRSEARMKPV